jgi:hypothetical protein
MNILYDGIQILPIFRFKTHNIGKTHVCKQSGTRPRKADGTGLPLEPDVWKHNARKNQSSRHTAGPHT